MPVDSYDDETSLSLPLNNDTANVNIEAEGRSKTMENENGLNSEMELERELELGPGQAATTTTATVRPISRHAPDEKGEEMHRSSVSSQNGQLLSPALSHISESSWLSEETSTTPGLGSPAVPAAAEEMGMTRTSQISPFQKERLFHRGEEGENQAAQNGLGEKGATEDDATSARGKGMQSQKDADESMLLRRVLQSGGKTVLGSTFGQGAMSAERQPHSDDVQLQGVPSPELPNNDNREQRRRTSNGESAGRRKSSTHEQERERILKLSPRQIHELTSSPKSIPLHPAPPSPKGLPSLADVPGIEGLGIAPLEGSNTPSLDKQQNLSAGRIRAGSAGGATQLSVDNVAQNTPTPLPYPKGKLLPSAFSSTGRPNLPSRTVSTPPSMRRKSSSSRLQNAAQSHTKANRTTPAPLQLSESKANAPQPSPGPVPSPMPQTIPLPPLSLPTYLQLELSSDRPSPLYIHRSSTSDFPYESSKIKFERLLNFLLLPWELEKVLWFGTLACLDAWLYSFTILPLRFFKALGILIRWWVQALVHETRYIAGFVYVGLGRMWRRRKQSHESENSAHSGRSADAVSSSRRPSLAGNVANGVNGSVSIAAENGNTTRPRTNSERKHHQRSTISKHRRTKSTPSALLPSHKADLLQGFLVITSCAALMRFDASRMYHGIRGQAAIKLYVIYNVLEVCDRLFSALGQDVLECLFSKETLERKADGRSKVIRPFWMFLLALVYNVVHATALFYQVITLNVAVNSYSNALLTLLMSNQFVEIKGTVFKKFEKENLFQLTCADVVERFQLWLMLLIIALRNIVEVGGLSIGSNLFGSSSLGGSSGAGSLGNNLSANAPLHSASILPKSFTIFPKWTGQVLGPFLLVLGSETLVDSLKHAYITKFNNTKPAIYGRFLDILAKDYYSNAFADQNLTRRLGLPVIPLSCLFIRASVQAYHMFLATHMPPPIAPPSTATSLSSVESTSSSPVTTAALQHIDLIFRRALGSSAFGAGVSSSSSSSSSASSSFMSFLPSPVANVLRLLAFWQWSTDDLIAIMTMLIFFLVMFLLLLALKLVLGMCLLSFARSRYKSMKHRESIVVDTGGKRIGGWGVVEVDEDKRRWIYHDDPDAARQLREREKNTREKAAKPDALQLHGVSRYTMSAKRIW
ncbi:DUF747-domain-containing protein [Xylona heveae TC161]|uniref:DUF747-domain-containing protein n=1 Tax=Xylona heveae (strain CBS 132557 / TC161) TaxID=1328760 RepID=A0A165FMA5_XYLHT|nr:DUF747-domain-containing protein [Xylona heveae TC161]KZF21149.1 DUF747-domain-containing protein [Xylona heveae TC161]